MAVQDSLDPEKQKPLESLIFQGFPELAPPGTRTPNQVIKSHLLYH